MPIQKCLLEGAVVPHCHQLRTMSHNTPCSCGYHTPPQGWPHCSPPPPHCHYKPWQHLLAGVHWVFTHPHCTGNKELMVSAIWFGDGLLPKRSAHAQLHPTTTTTREAQDQPSSSKTRLLFFQASTPATNPVLLGSWGNRKGSINLSAEEGGLQEHKILLELPSPLQAKSNTINAWKQQIYDELRLWTILITSLTAFTLFCLWLSCTSNYRKRKRCPASSRHPTSSLPHLQNCDGFKCQDYNLTPAEWAEVKLEWIKNCIMERRTIKWGKNGMKKIKEAAKKSSI